MVQIVFNSVQQKYKKVKSALYIFRKRPVIVGGCVSSLIISRKNMVTQIVFDFKRIRLGERLVSEAFPNLWKLTKNE